jgi:hypothetical protein
MNSAHISEIIIDQDMVPRNLSATAVLNEIQIHVPLEILIDVEVEQTHLIRGVEENC